MEVGGSTPPLATEQSPGQDPVSTCGFLILGAQETDALVIRRRVFGQAAANVVSFFFSDLVT